MPRPAFVDEVAPWWIDAASLQLAELVASFARPGGNVTGICMLSDALDGKRLELVPQEVAYKAIIAEAAAQRIPAIYEWGFMARAGGLMAYGPALAELQDRAADYVARVLRDANPGELPIEQPTKLELVVNVATAKALGMAMPPRVLERADEVAQ